MTESGPILKFEVDRMPFPRRDRDRSGGVLTATGRPPGTTIVSPRLFHTLFGDPIDALEDKGDELRLNGFHREAAWYYRQARERLGSRAAARRAALDAKHAESRATAFRQILDEAESMAQRGRRREAMSLVTDAGRIAEGIEETTEAQGRWHSLRQRLDTPHSQPGQPVEHEPGGGSSGGGPAVPRVGPFEPAPSLGPNPRTPLAAPPLSAASSGLVPTLEGELDPRRLRALARDPAAAIERYSEEIRLRPESAAAHELLGEALRAAGRPQEARTQLEAAYRRNPERMRLVVATARLLRDALGDPEGALLRLEQGCRRHHPTPASLPLHLERAFLLAELGRHDQALARFSELLSVGTLDRGALLFNRAGVFEQADQPDAALADLESAVQAAPDAVLYRERLADLCARRPDTLDLGLRHLEEALALAAHDFARPRGEPFPPDRARLHYKVAHILFLMGRDDEARERIEEALIVCVDPRVQEGLLDLRRELGR